MSTRLTPYARWAAYLSAVAAILGLVSLLLFFGLEATPNSAQGFHIWGPLSDIFPIIQMLLLVVVARALYVMERRTAPGLSLFAGVIGLVGMLGVALLQFLLIMKVIPFEQEVGPVVVATGVVGVWLILANHIGRVQGLLRARLAWLGIAVGVAFLFEPAMLSMVGGGVDWRNIMSNYILLIGSALIFLVAYVGFPVWATWLGRTLTAAGHEAASRPNARGVLGRQVQ